MQDEDAQSVRHDFGDRLKILRKQSDISQEQLAHLSGLDRSYVGQVERGERNVSLQNIHRLAKALGKSPADLFENDSQCEAVVGNE